MRLSFHPPGPRASIPNFARHRGSLRLASIFILLATPAAAQIFDIAAPVAAVSPGQSVQLTPFLYFDNHPVSNATFQWGTSDPTILTVDSRGMLTGAGLGTATITLTSVEYAGNATLEMQVIPASMTVTPAYQQLYLGDAPFRFTATAFDFFNNPIPSAPIQWEFTGETGLPDTYIATLSPDGVLTPTGTGRLTIRAYIPYIQREGKPSRYEALATVDIALHKAYSLNRILTNDARAASTLRPSPGFFSGNDKGQLVFSGSLDALASGALIYDGSFHPVITGGVPAPFPGGVVAGFFSAAINNNGQALVAVKAGVNRSDGGLVVGDVSGSNYVLLDGSTAGSDPVNPQLNLNSMQITPHCFNDNGTIAFLAAFNDQDSSTPRQGIFRMYPGQLPELVWATDQPLPGVPASSGNPFATLDNTSQQPGWGGPNGLGIDGNDNVFFMANLAAARALFIWKGTGTTPVKIIAKGDAFANSTVKDIQDLTVLKNGDLALHIDINAGAQNVVLYSHTNYSVPAASIAVQANPDLRVLAANTINGTDAVLFTGLPPTGGGTVTGLYKWQGSTTLVFAQTNPITYIHAAALGSSGNIAAVVRRTDNDFAVIRQDGSGLFAAGAAISTQTPLHLTNIVQGSRATLPSILVGDPASVFDITSPDTFSPRVRVGDRLNDGSGFSGTNDVFEDRTGAQYFLSTPGGLYQSANGQTKLLLALNSKAPDGAGIVLRKLWGVNSSGSILIETNTTLASLQRRLYILDSRSTLALISSTGDPSPFNTGAVTGWDQAAIDDAGRVMALVDSPGGNGLVLFQGTQKTATILLGRDALGGETAVFVANLKASGNRFYARISLTLDFFHSCVSMFDSAWHALTQSGLNIPNGETMGYIQSTDANSSGDAIFTVQLIPSGSFAVVVRRAADATLRIVHENSTPTDSGDYILRHAAVNLRDDGTPYFLALDVNDRALIFQGVPVP